MWIPSSSKPYCLFMAPMSNSARRGPLSPSAYAVEGPHHTITITIGSGEVVPRFASFQIEAGLANLLAAAHAGSRAGSVPGVALLQEQDFPSTGWSPTHCDQRAHPHPIEFEGRGRAILREIASGYRGGDTKGGAI